MINWNRELTPRFRKWVVKNRNRIANGLLFLICLIFGLDFVAAIGMLAKYGWSGVERGTQAMEVSLAIPIAAILLAVGGLGIVVYGATRWKILSSKGVLPTLFIFPIMGIGQSSGVINKVISAGNDSLVTAQAQSLVGWLFLSGGMLLCWFYLVNYLDRFNVGAEKVES